MPTYEYKCASCGFRFEKRQRFDEDPLSLCPNCEETSLHRVFHSAPIIFKGSGFYVTDSRNSDVTPAKQKNSPAKQQTSKQK